MPNNLIQVNEYIVAQQIIHFVLPRIMSSAQPANFTAFVSSVMIDVHSWILLPAVEHPVDESLESEFFLVPIMSPPITKFHRTGCVVARPSAEEVFHAARNQWITFHIEENVG